MCKLHAISDLGENQFPGGRSRVTRRATRGTSGSVARTSRPARIRNRRRSLHAAHLVPGRGKPVRVTDRARLSTIVPRPASEGRNAALILTRPWRGLIAWAYASAPGSGGVGSSGDRSQHRAACRLVDRRGPAEVEVVVGDDVVPWSAVGDGATGLQGDVVVARPAVDGAGAFETQRIVSWPSVERRGGASVEPQTVVARPAAEPHGSVGGGHAPDSRPHRRARCRSGTRRPGIRKLRRFHPSRYCVAAGARNGRRPVPEKPRPVREPV